MKEISTVPIYEKVALSVDEASEYSNIGKSTLYELMKTPRCPFLLIVGKRKLIKRKEFEKFISENMYIN